MSNFNKFVFGDTLLGTPQKYKRDNKTMFKKLYMGLSPFVLPLFIALTMFFAFKSNEIVEINRPVTQTITETITLPAIIERVPYMVTDTLYLTNTFYKTVRDTIILPGDTTYVNLASANTYLSLTGYDGKIRVDTDVVIGVRYFYEPVNRMEIKATLQDVKVSLPKPKLKTYFTSGVYFNTNKVYMSIGLFRKSNYFSILHDGKTAMFGYQHVFGR